MQQTAQFSKSKVSCLLRHRGGKYYASAKVVGKIVRRCLDTNDFNLAKLRLPAVLAEMRGATNASKASTLGKAIDEEAEREDPHLDQSTREYYQQIAISLQRVGALLPQNPLNKPINRVVLTDLRTLMDKFATSSRFASGTPSPGSPSRYNGALALLRRTYKQAIEHGHVGSNVPDGLKRMKTVSKEMELPTAERFATIVADILSQKKRHSKATAAAVEFLAYTGLRISEAQNKQWKHIKADHLLTRTAKNDKMRQVPLIPAARGLLDRLREEGVPSGPEDPVMLVKSPRIALENSCKRLGIDHMRVHDLRHIFATRCIESGVDLPTLADWLGHKDGGILCTQVYGHLCKKHSNEMAAKVKA
jgi:integrase